MSFRGEHTDHGLLLGNEKKRPAGRCNSVNKPEMHSAKQKKPDSKGYLLLDSVVISIVQPSGIFCPPNEKTKRWFLAAGGGADYKGAHVFGGARELQSCSDLVCGLYETEHLCHKKAPERLHFTLCKLYLN